MDENIEKPISNHTKKIFKGKKKMVDDKKL